MKKYRNEWKFLVNNQTLSLLKTRLEQVMDLDPYTPPGGRYLIHSLYFDDHKDTAVYTTDAGISRRYKWRIRYYNNDPQDHLVLEKKEKLESRCHKESCKLSIQEYKDIVASDIPKIAYNSQKPLIQKLASDMLRYNYRPKVIVDYERIAFIEEPLNIRVTIDMKISASYEIDKFLNGNYIVFPLSTDNQSVLEVKYDDVLPARIRKIIEPYNFQQTAFSKYYFCRKIIDSYLR